HPDRISPARLIGMHRAYVVQIVRKRLTPNAFNADIKERSGFEAHTDTVRNDKLEAAIRNALRLQRLERVLFAVVLRFRIHIHGPDAGEPVHVNAGTLIKASAQGNKVDDTNGVPFKVARSKRKISLFTRRVGRAFIVAFNGEV